MLVPTVCGFCMQSQNRQKTSWLLGILARSGLVGLPKTSRVKFKNFKNVKKMLKNYNHKEDFW
jgi:hypothetical protein